jgi:hypothetical protein
VGFSDSLILKKYRLAVNNYYVIWPEGQNLSFVAAKVFTAFAELSVEANIAFKFYRYIL